MAQYLIRNGASAPTSAMTKVGTGTALKTMLQVKASATKPAKIVEWGISFDGSAAATPIRVELLETDIAAVVTAHAAAGINKLDPEAVAGGDPTTNLFPVGVSGTGYTATTEGAPTSARVFDFQLVAPTNQYVKQFPLGREPVIQVSKFARIRLRAATAVSAYCYLIVEV